ncbi:glucosyltransferase domain-containing protein [Faecalicatena sp. AGMB00832]|uniref:Glucosyltransferase domain-containing protein n=1 Tax=Faecalicatena faecalis TaxID=2726362 RepID=A0ABS6D0H3_9FIRM|nr:glucosyltransferase domain-containing protein [Faecalicatena faecalis]MBU3874737.1 glucosyltransferase domain-containing protein [Faecalicatena faecalis]
MKLKKYIVKWKNVFITAAIFSFLCFCYMLVNPGISIDEETWIQIEKPFAMWLVQGRWGIDLFNFFSGNHWRYAPVLWDILAIVIWNGAGIIFSYAMFGDKVKKIPLFFFQAYFCSLPFVLGEMFSFSMFSLQISLGMFCTAIAFHYSILTFELRKKQKWLFALMCLVYAFSVYQSYICVYITAVCAYGFISFFEKEEKVWKKICSCAVLCLIGIGIYYTVHFILMKFVGTTSYLSDNYVGWFDAGGIGKALFLAFANVVRVSFAIPIAGEYIYGGEVIRSITVAFILIVLWYVVKEKTMNRKAGILFFSFALIISPFSLFLALGTYKTHGRVLLGLALAGAVEIYILFNAIKERTLEYVGIIAGAYILFLNAKNMNMLYYSANVAYEHDRTIANQVMYDIKKSGYDYHKEPIVFLGMEKMDDVGLVVSDTVGSSIFEWDDGNILRMCNFMKTEGYRVVAPDRKDILRALEFKGTMKSWPQEGSIIERDGIIIVFFSEPSDKWYSINLI